MNLAQAMLRANASDISDAAKKVFKKKTGKQKGLDAIENEIRKSAEDNVRQVLGRVPAGASSRIEKYTSGRMKYMRNAFKQLNNPQKDRSDERADFIGDWESRAARSFGTTLGYEKSGRRIAKTWVCGANPCDDCQENEDAGPIGIDEYFPSGAYSLADSHPNCDCDIEYVEDMEASHGGSGRGSIRASINFTLRREQRIKTRRLQRNKRQRANTYT